MNIENSLIHYCLSAIVTSESSEGDNDNNSYIIDSSDNSNNSDFLEKTDIFFECKYHSQCETGQIDNNSDPVSLFIVYFLGPMALHIEIHAEGVVEDLTGKFGKNDLETYRYTPGVDDVTELRQSFQGRSSCCE